MIHYASSLDSGARTKTDFEISAVHDYRNPEVQLTIKILSNREPVLCQT